MSYRALWTADVHVHNGLPYAKRDPETLLTDRLVDTLDVFIQMDEYAARNEIEEIWIVGDLFDKRLLDAVTLKFLVSTLADMTARRAFRMIGGNHDAHDAAGTHYTLDVLRKVGLNRLALLRVGVVEVGGTVFLPIPYKPERRAREILERAAKDPRAGELVVVAHQTVMGARSGAWKAPDGLRLSELAPFAATILGHHHTPQDLAENVFYLGAPLQHVFGDAGEVRGFWDITFEGPRIVRRELIPVEAPRFHVIPIRASEKGEIDIEGAAAREASPGEDDYVQITVRGTEQAIKRVGKGIEAYRRLLLDERDVRLVKVTQHVEAPEKDRLKITKEAGGRISLPAAVESYVEHMNPAGLDRAALLELGRAALRVAEGEERDV